MARSRNIKPAFFDNDELAENDPLGRLLFIGLWTLADHNGNLEWRSKKIKKQLLAYDDCCIDSLAINLDLSGFVRFYSDGEKIYLNIVNFGKHQNPHKNEVVKGTEIPDFSESYRQLVDLKGLTINHDKSGVKREDSTCNPADSLLLIPDSFNLIPDNKRSMSSKLDAVSVLEYLNSSIGANFKSTTTSHIKNISARLKEGNTVDDLKMVIDFKVNDWVNNPKNRQYLRPQTLFSPSKFDGYLMAAKGSNKFSLEGIKHKTGSI